MLQIITNDQVVDISPDTAIHLNIENPLISPDHIPVPYSFSYELPLTPHNSMIFGFPHRHTSDGGFGRYPTDIMFGGLRIASGEQIIEEVSDTISVSFSGAIFPADIRRHLQNHDFGQALFGDKDTVAGDPAILEFYGTMTAKSNYNKLLLPLLSDDYPDFVAAPVALKPDGWMDLDPESSDTYKNQRANFLNAYSKTIFDSDGYLFYDPSVSIVGFMSKIMPSFRVGWILDSILDGRLVNNIFNIGDWRRLMVLSLHHPSYTIQTQFGVWDYKDHDFRVSFADFLPSVPANEFIVEFLKLACASLYINGDSYAIELNDAILSRTLVRDWSDMVIGTPVVGVQPEQDYIYGYSSDAGAVPAERAITHVTNIIHMWSDSMINENLATYSVASTGQVIESVADESYPSRRRFNVLKQDMGGSERADADDEDRDADTYDMSFGGDVLRTNLRRMIHSDVVSLDLRSENNNFYYCPETEPLESDRPDSLTIALYHGLHTCLGDNPTTTVKYPFLSHGNVDSRGGVKGDLTLRWSGSDGLIERYHSSFKSWVQSRRVTLKCILRLSHVDLHNLDLRDKYHIHGRDYFINTISISLRPSSIDPAEVEFIEAP